MPERRRTAASLTILVVILAALVVPARADTPMVVERLYVPMADGVQLAVTVARPAEPGRYPTLLTYGPYGDGSQTESFSQPEASFFVPRGYAFVSASIRGTGCSGGQFDQVFSATEARDGATLVQWAASQPWSTGKVGLTGSSYPGINQFFVAAQHPPALAAIAPMSTLGDLYRDVVYPGGVFNPVFADGWTLGLQPALSTVYGPLTDIPKGDTICAANEADHVANNWRTNAGLFAVENPTDVDWYAERSPNTIAASIDVPVFMGEAFQDHQVGSRGLITYDVIRAPKKLTVGNGLHNTPRTTPIILDQLARWFDYWLKADTTNGIMDEPPVTVLLEADETSHVPSTIVRSSSWPIDGTSFTSLYLRAGGALSWDAPSTAETADPYGYPAGQSTLAHDGLPPAGGTSYLSDPFPADQLIGGPSELDLFAITSAPDIDWYVSLSDVDPAGNATFLTKGLLKASHRAIDESRSLLGRPYHTHTNPQPVPVGSVVAYHVELLPFAQPIRKGDRLRLDFLAPSVISEPWWGYAAYPVPSISFIEHSPGMASHLVLPVVQNAPPFGPRPACGTVDGEPCGTFDPSSP